MANIRAWFISLVSALLLTTDAWAAEPRVAVLDITAPGGWSAGLADFVEAGLQKAGVATYDRRFLRALLAERGLSRSGVLDPSSVRTAQLPAMDLFVSGVVSPAGTNRFALTLEAVRAADAVMAVSLHAEGRYPQDWLPTLERLAGELSIRLRERQSASGKASFSRAITWMPEASLWFFRGLDCSAHGDAAQAVLAFGKARRWDRHFRMAWLWESRSYQQLGFSAQARRVLEAGHLSEHPLGQALQHPVFAVVAGPGVPDEVQQTFIRKLVNSGKVSVLNPRWIGASAREADLQFTGEMAARTEAGNAWLVVDQVVFLERALRANGPPEWQARQQAALTGQVHRQVQAPATPQGLDELAVQLLKREQGNDRAEALVPRLQVSRDFPVSLPLNPDEAELARCLARAAQDPSDVRALLAAADACQAWEGDAAYFNGTFERGVEWRVREEFLAQAVAAVRRNPGQKEAAFWLASALWRQRYTPEYSIWAGTASGIPLREHMKPLLELFPQSAEATNLAEAVTENIVHNRRSLPVDARYLQPPFPAASTPPPPLPVREEKPDAEERRAQFRSLFYEKKLDRAAVLFSQLAFDQVRMDRYEQEEFIKMMLRDERAASGFVPELERIIQTPEVNADTRHTAAFHLAAWHYQRADYFRATDLLRELLADETDTRGNQEAAYALLKHVRLFGDGELDFCRCCGEMPMLPDADPAELAAVEKLFRERLSLACSVGRPTAEILDHNWQEMKRVEKILLDQHRDALPAFLQRQIKNNGPGPETLGLCGQLGSQALPLLPQIVAAVRQHDNPSTQNNALYALSSIGQPAACALPVVILALETADPWMAQPAAHVALQRLGVAPRRVIPYLARLLYHPNPAVVSNAAAALFAAAKLPAELRAGLNDDEFVLRLQGWWENTGAWQNWNP